MPDLWRAKGITPYQHQVETRNFILKNKRCFVLDEMGLGKTMSSIEACELLFDAEKIKCVLIVAPLSGLRATWQEHFTCFYPHRTVRILHGTSRRRRIEELNRPAHYYVINTDGIKVIFEELLAFGFDVLIIDESTTFACHQSDRTKAAWSLSNTIPSVVAMTGEPCPNDLIQSYAQAKLIHFDNPKYFTRFRDKLKIKLDMYNYIDKPGAKEEAWKVLQPAIRHTREQCLDLPPITYETRDIPMTREQAKLYAQMEKDYIAWLNSGEEISAPNAAVRATKLMQISAGLLIDPSGEYHKIDHKHRIKELEEIYGQLPIKKLIVFANFTKSIVDLAKYFGDRAAVIDGGVSGTKRAEILKDFQFGDLEILIGQPRALSHSVTLHASNCIVWWSPTYSNETYMQCNARIRRVGQKRPQFVVRFQSSKIEKGVYKALQRKQSVSHALLSLYADEG